MLCLLILALCTFRVQNKTKNLKTKIKFKNMEIQRKQEIEQEVKRRLHLWIENSSFEEMSAFGSYMRFEMSIGLIGYPFEKKNWMKDNDFERFITDDELRSDEVDTIITYFFNIANKI